ncbi:MAG: pyruvate kinase, partial [Myxococcales bacterium]|nr:pyruvate kinase [Myxococcales bacterium]
RRAVDALTAIVDIADGAMVARGDLGVELPVEEVPELQKRIIRTTVSNGKPVITATQMLDSMERNPRPTRAEASDVANAIFDGTSAVMLSGETAAGIYPVEAVTTMDAIARRAEQAIDEFGTLQNIQPNPSNQVTEAVAQAARTMSTHLSAPAIVAVTETGFTARMISKYRPRCPIVAVTASEKVMRTLAMNWGVIAIHAEGTDEARVEIALDRAREMGLVNPGDVVVATGGISQNAGATNMIRVVTC